MRWIIVSLILLCAACTTTETPTDLPFYTATPRFVEPVARPTEGSDSLLDFAGGEPVAVDSIRTFQYTVSGDVSALVTQGNIVYNFIAAVGDVSARDKIFISSADASASQQLAFEFSPGLAPDTYLLTSPANWFPGSVTAQYLRLSADGENASRIQAYSQNVSGTLTLHSVGETISGVFEFTADWVTGNDMGETVTRTATVTGEFSNIPYSRMADPFEAELGVPERATPEPLVGGD